MLLNLHDSDLPQDRRQPARRPGPEDLEAVRVEMTRCLRLMIHLFPDPDFVANPPEVRVLDEYPPLPESPLCATKSHQLVLYTRGDLNRPCLEVLATLLHRAVHLANAFHWIQDCTSWSYHHRSFRRLAETVGFEVSRPHRRYGWAATEPGPKLLELFHDLAVDPSALEVFQDRATPLRKGIRCHCHAAQLPAYAPGESTCADGAGV